MVYDASKDLNSKASRFRFHSFLLRYKQTTSVGKNIRDLPDLSDLPDIIRYIRHIRTYPAYPAYPDMFGGYFIRHTQGITPDMPDMIRLYPGKPDRIRVTRIKADFTRLTRDSSG